MFGLFKSGKKSRPITPTEKLLKDPFHGIFESFYKTTLPALPLGSKVLEIGSRARSQITRKEFLPEGVEYIGFDIKEGPNVDVLGDVHRLSEYIEAESVDVVFSNSVFEHLFMPWKAVLEINKVMKVGGISFHASHQCWPLHEVPWDFWRYSDQAWRALFNEFTGFEVEQAVLGEPGRVIPHYFHEGVRDVDKFPVYLASAVIARKTSSSELDWPAPTGSMLPSEYPG